MKPFLRPTARPVLSIWPGIAIRQTLVACTALKKRTRKKGILFLTLVSDERSPQPFATMTRCVGNGNHQCRGSGIKQTSSLNGTTNQKAKLKKAIAARKGWGGKGCLKNIGKSGNN